MKSRYYYFIASLTHLSFSQSKPVSWDRFLTLCNSFLQKKDLSIIKSISLAAIGKEAARLETMKQWMDWDKAFREELARLRADRLGRQTIAAERGESPAAAHAAAAAREVFELDSPLHADEQMDRIKWDYIDALEFGRYFDVEWLALYSLKLHILERRESFDEKAGLQRLRNVLETARENYGIEAEPVEANLG